eukprot:g4728.t1
MKGSQAVGILILFLAAAKISGRVHVFVHGYRSFAGLILPYVENKGALLRKFVDKEYFCVHMGVLEIVCGVLLVEGTRDAAAAAVLTLQSFLVVLAAASMNDRPNAMISLVVLLLVLPRGVTAVRDAMSRKHAAYLRQRSKKRPLTSDVENRTSVGALVDELSVLVRNCRDPNLKAVNDNELLIRGNREEEKHNRGGRGGSFRFTRQKVKVSQVDKERLNSVLGKISGVLDKMLDMPDEKLAKMLASSSSSSHRCACCEVRTISLALPCGCCGGGTATSTTTSTGSQTDTDRRKTALLPPRHGEEKPVPVHTHDNDVPSPCTLPDDVIDDVAGSCAFVRSGATCVVKSCSDASSTLLVEDDRGNRKPAGDAGILMRCKCSGNDDTNCAFETENIYECTSGKSCPPIVDTTPYLSDQLKHLGHTGKPLPLTPASGTGGSYYQHEACSGYESTCELKCGAKEYKVPEDVPRTLTCAESQWAPADVLPTHSFVCVRKTCQALSSAHGFTGTCAEPNVVKVDAECEATCELGTACTYTSDDGDSQVQQSSVTMRCACADDDEACLVPTLRHDAANGPITCAPKACPPIVDKTKYPGEHSSSATRPPLCESQTTCELTCAESSFSLPERLSTPLSCEDGKWSVLGTTNAYECEPPSCESSTLPSFLVILPSKESYTGGEAVDVKCKDGGKVFSGDTPLSEKGRCECGSSSPCHIAVGDLLGLNSLECKNAHEVCGEIDANYEEGGAKEKVVCAQYESCPLTCEDGFFPHLRESATSIVALTNVSCDATKKQWVMEESGASVTEFVCTPKRCAIPDALKTSIKCREGETVAESQMCTLECIVDDMEVAFGNTVTMTVAAATSPSNAVPRATVRCECGATSCALKDVVEASCRKRTCPITSPEVASTKERAGGGDAKRWPSPGMSPCEEDEGASSVEIGKE